MAEIARMYGDKLWLQQKIAEKRRRIDALEAMMLALKTNRAMQPVVTGAYQKASRRRRAAKPITEFRENPCLLSSACAQTIFSIWWSGVGSVLALPE